MGIGLYFFYLNDRLMMSIYAIMSSTAPTHVLSPFRDRGVAYLFDPASYTGCSSDRLKG